MIRATCRHCGESSHADFSLPLHCPHCGELKWHDLASVAVIVSRLKLAVRDILRNNPFAGILKTPAGNYVALIPYMCDRALANPDFYGEFQGTITDIEQIEPMLFGPHGIGAIKTRATSSAFSIGVKRR